MDLETWLELAGAVSLCIAGVLFLGTAWTPAVTPVSPENLWPAGLMAMGYGMAFVGGAAMSDPEGRRSHPTVVLGAAALAGVAEAGGSWQVLLGAGTLFVVAAVLVVDGLRQ